MNVCIAFLRLLVFVFVSTRLLLAEVSLSAQFTVSEVCCGGRQGRSVCEGNAKESCVSSGRWQLHFKNKLSLDERPKCKTTSKKETLKLRWDMPQGVNGSATVFCFLFSPESIEHIVRSTRVSLWFCDWGCFCENRVLGAVVLCRRI